MSCDILPGKRQKQALQSIIIGCVVLTLLLSGCTSLLADKPVSLTADEKQWLTDHAEELTVVTSNWPPYDFFASDGAYRGYVADYVSLLQQKLGVRFRIVPTRTWAESEQLAMNHQAAMITTIKYSPERAQKLNFAGPFRVVPIAILTRSSVQGTISFEKLTGKKVAYVKGYFTGEAIRSTYPNIILQAVPDDLAGARLLSLGGVDAFVSDVGVVAYHAEREGINNLRVAGDTGYQYVLNIGVRKDWPILAEVLQKGINAISAEENDRLYHKWVSLQSEKAWETREFWLILGVILSLALTAVGLAIFWNRMLRRKVDQRTQELAISEKKYRSLYDNAISGIFQTTLQGTILSVNPAFVRMFGYDLVEAEAVQASITSLAEQVYVHADDRHEFMSRLLRDGRVVNFEAQFYCKDRSIVWVMLNALLVKDEAGTPLYIEGNCVDIGERKRAEQELIRLHNGLERLVEERTQELFAANQELTALNEEMTALNENLVDANHKLNQEVDLRRSVEHGLVLREKQYQATVNLVATSTTIIEETLNSILHDALKLIKAPGGTIGLINENNQYVISHASGEVSNLSGWTTSAVQGAFGRVRESGEFLHIDNYRTFGQRIEDERLARLTTMVMIPLKRQGTVIGAFTAMWTGEIGHVNPEDVEILRQYGNLASVVLEKAYAQKQITLMAFQDSLTGLPNRASLAERLEAEMHQARNGEAAGTLFFIDLDDLKMVNDNFGHTCGDSVIISAGRQIAAALGMGAFVARMGGDEFVALLPGIDQRSQAALIADRLVQTLQGEYDVCGQRLHMSASVGVTMYPTDAGSTEEILKTADSAMYSAKADGRNCWRFFEAAMRDEVYYKLILTNSLRRALEREELYLQYQPQLDLRTGTVIGFEALIRWRSEEHGAMSPAMFIPLTEQSGLIRPIGEWVLRQACRFARQIADMGHGDLHVAVNISPRQLETADFVKMVSHSLEQAGIASSQLELEITESVLIGSLDDSIDKLTLLRKMGVRLSLDDFGTGFSSLTYLRRLPVQMLKIDRSFIEGITEGLLQKNFVESIIDMAHVLGLLVVAEGVETEAQQQILSALDCDCLQGYYFSRPINEQDAIGFLGMAKNLCQ